MTDTTEVDDFLAHYGVKGMKWGQRRSGSPSASQVYKARNTVANEKRNIQNQRHAVRRAVRPETKAKRNAKLAEMKLEHLKNPDRATAQRITKGDLALTGLFAVASPFSAGATAASIGAGAAVRVGKRKAAERRVSKETAKTPANKKIKPSGNVSAVTKKAIADHNNMTDGEFQRKYSVSKKTYAKRVEKYGDPYMNSPAAKLGKKLAGKS